MRAWSRQERLSTERSADPAAKSLSPKDVAAFIAWIACAPAEMVLNEVIVTPMLEEAWP
jgi:NADP-dependent 3-hydroxy acid dehydrogenase YdfG